MEAASLKESVAMPILLEVEEKCDGQAVRELSEEDVRKGLSDFAGVKPVESNPREFVRDMRRVCRMSSKRCAMLKPKMQEGANLQSYLLNKSLGDPVCPKG